MSEIVNQPSILATYNHHSHDDNIRFYQQGHKYEILDDKFSKYTSVTTWVHANFEKFNADAVIKNIMNGKNWAPGHKYWGMTPTQISLMWKNTGTESATAGTKLHAQIEDFMNNRDISPHYHHQQLYDAYKAQCIDDTQCAAEWNYFIQFVRDHPHLKPYRTEWMVYDKQYKIAGSIDMVYETQDGHLEIYDWKRSKEIIRSSDWNKTSNNPLISHVPDTNYWHYALQLNTYRHLLEKNYGKKVTKLCLVRLHPNNENETYEILDVPIMDKEIHLLFDELLRSKS
jgi:ATP-dependent exoDNAse (exonuclease V) beta subunit